MKKKKVVEKKKSHSVVQFILDMHSAESKTSWTRWMGTFIVSNIMIMWSLNCVFGNKVDGDGKIIGQMVDFSLVDIPYGLVGIITAVILGKVGQSYVERKQEECNGPRMD